jgi:hypothetical protein
LTLAAPHVLFLFMDAFAPDTVAYERALRLLERLIEIGMGLVKAAHRRSAEPDADLSTMVRVFAQASRGLRHAIALDTRLAQGDPRPVVRREDEVSAIVTALIGSGRTDWLLPDREELEEDLGDHLGLENDFDLERLEFEDFLEPDEVTLVRRRHPVETVVRICFDLGVEATWTDGDWEIRALPPRRHDA